MELLKGRPLNGEGRIKLKMRDVINVYLKATKHDMTVVKLVGE